MKFLHSMIRVNDLEKSIKFFEEGFGLRELRRMEHEKGKFTLVFMAEDENSAAIELTYNWGITEDYGNARNFGHLAFLTKDIYAACENLQNMGVTINRPPRDGHMAFVKTPDNISIELIQDGYLEPKEPWVSMENIGSW